MNGMHAPVRIARAARVGPGNLWEDTLPDLLLQAAQALGADGSIDGLFCAVPTAALVQRQLNVAAAVAERCGLDPHAVCMALEAGENSGAAAVHAACAHLRAGLASRVLVIAAAKVSDLGEQERLAMMSAAIDQESEAALGLSYHAALGLIADARQAAHPGWRDAMDRIVLAAAAHPAARHRLTPEELQADLPRAEPLRRLDFAELMDGAYGVLLERCDDASGAAGCLCIAALATHTGPLALGDRAGALGEAPPAMPLLRRLGLSEPPPVLHLEDACALFQEMLQAALRPGAGCTVNPGGGSLAAGHVPGASGVAHLVAAHAFASGAGAAAGPQLSICMGAAGAQLHATLLEVR